MSIDPVPPSAPLSRQLPLAVRVNSSDVTVFRRVKYGGELALRQTHPLIVTFKCNLKLSLLFGRYLNWLIGIFVWGCPFPFTLVKMNLSLG